MDEDEERRGVHGENLRHDPARGTWVGDKTKSFDSAVKRSGDRVIDLDKNT
jgi:hypothetical protein